MGVSTQDDLDMPAAGAPAVGTIAVHRHSALVRVTHWMNAVAVAILLMSGLQIFNAHPALYWGSRSDFDHPLLAIGAEQASDGRSRGVTRVLGRTFDTTGMLGVYSRADGQQVARAFPSWATLPGFQSLADGRLWHLFFAWVLVLNGAVYVISGLTEGHFWNRLVPTRLALSAIGRTAWDHLRLRFPEGEEARHYNSIQQITYLILLVAVFPALILGGLAMSPRLDASLPWLLPLFGGRQSARTVHFVAAFSLVAFVAVHVLMVILTGPWNNIRSMLTGRFHIRHKPAPHV